MLNRVENWRAICGFIGHYEVSDLGRIRSLDRTLTDRIGRIRRVRGSVLSPSAQPHSGHLHVNLKLAGRSRSVAVHALVLEAFVGPRPHGLECCHGDGNPANNRVDNLRWDTRSANIFDSVRHGTNVNAEKMRCKKGHAYTERNTIHRRGGGRVCRECARLASARCYARRVDVQHGTNVNARKTHCVNGHAFDESNTYRPPGRPNYRGCRKCMRARDASRRGAARA
jgi:hypothetical protein